MNIYVTMSQRMDQTGLIRERLDIVSFISEYMPVKKAGRNFNALCPFHTEKSPSFVISPERQMWHCFGCSKGGDVFSFLMEYERVEFPEALRILAQRTGVELQTSKAQTDAISLKEKLYEINASAMEFYHYVLTKHAIGKKALAYIQKRGVDPRVIETFKLGFAPSGGNSLLNYLMKKKKYTKEAIADAGLATSKSYYVGDFFRNRIIFPLLDHRQNVVGFSGRLFDETVPAVGGKYINTRDTPVYHKRDQFYGIHITKEAIRKENQAILVEGEFDVLACFQYGIPNVVAVKGTALTETQVSLLARFAQKITICFDGDSAGKEAVKRSLPIIEKKGVQVSIVVIPDGKDPDESLRVNESAFKMALKHETGAYDYLLSLALSSADKNTPDGKRAIAHDLLPVFGAIENAIVKEHYLRKLSQELDTSYESITREMQKEEKKETLIEKVQAITKKERSREEVLEEYLLSLIMQSANPKQMLDVSVAVLEHAISKERAYQKLFHHLLSYFETQAVFDSKLFATSLPTELLSAYDKSLLLPISQFVSEERYMLEVKKKATELRELYIKEKRKRLGKEMTDAEKNGDEELLKKLQEEYIALKS